MGNHKSKQQQQSSFNKSTSGKGSESSMTEIHKGLQDFHAERQEIEQLKRVTYCK